MATQATQADTAVHSGNFSEINRKQRWCIDLLLFWFGERISVEYADNLTQAPEPSILAFNHNTTFETLLVPAYLFHLCGSMKCTFVVDWMFSHLPIAGWFLKQVDPIHVYNKPSTLPWLNFHRNRAPRIPVLEQCLSRLDQGQSIGIFPEGTRNRNPFTLLKAKKGLGRLVLAAQKPVIPIGIDFPQRIQNHKIPTWGPIVLRIGAPMDFSAAHRIMGEASNNPDLPTHTFKKIHQLLAGLVTTEIMREIACLSGKSYPYPPPEIPLELKPYFEALPPSNARIQYERRN